MNAYNIFKYKNYEFSDYTTPEILDEVCKFEFLPTDIILSTFPRSGTTFTQEIIWQIKNRKITKKDEMSDNNITRFPFLEFHYKHVVNVERNSIEILNSQKNQPYRMTFTHVPYSLIRENVEKTCPKFIVVIRNPKDCLVSNFHFLSNMPKPFLGTFDDFFNSFLDEGTFNGRYFDDNLKWWSLRNRDNVLILFYEDLLRQLPTNVEKIASFLGETLTEDDRDKIVHNSTFSVMYKNPKINIRFNSEFTFLRKGEIGDWKNHFSKEQNEKIEERIEKKFKESGIKFVYE